MCACCECSLVLFMWVRGFSSGELSICLGPLARFCFVLLFFFLLSNKQAVSCFARSRSRSLPVDVCYHSSSTIWIHYVDYFTSSFTEGNHKHHKREHLSILFFLSSLYFFVFVFQVTQLEFVFLVYFCDGYDELFNLRFFFFFCIMGIASHRLGTVREGKGGGMGRPAGAAR